jgi:hypothetical protein
MIATTENDLTTLGERRRQLADRLEELRTEQAGILDDVAAAEQDFLDGVETGEDTALLGERVELRKRELSNSRKAVDHLTAIRADVDAQIAGITARERLAVDVQAYHEARIDYNAALPDLPDSLPAAVEIISDALDGLLAVVDTARADHDRLLGTAGQLRQRADQLDVEIDVPDPADWSAGLNKIDKDGPYRLLALATMQRRGARAVLAEIERVILLELDAKRRAAR